jgi:hypothetical protein
LPPKKRRPPISERKPRAENANVDG